LHATISDVDLAEPFSPTDFERVEAALGRHGVLSFPGQKLTPQQFRHFSAQFGELERNVANSRHEPGIPEMMILSNILVDGNPIGMADAGQGWHTDLSYRQIVGYTTILYGIQIPHRDGEPLGSTEFCNMHAAYEGLPSEMKTGLDGMTVQHDFNKFWEMMRVERGSSRPILTAAQREARPPASHPIFLSHPLTNKKVLYADPGYSVRINELSPEESDRVLDFLFKHQTQEEYRYAHRWSPGDVLMWDDIGTIHNAVPDYLPSEPRLLKRCQVTGSRFFPVNRKLETSHALS
jgi:taurine dioxygenase